MISIHYTKSKRVGPFGLLLLVDYRQLELMLQPVLQSIVNQLAFLISLSVLRLLYQLLDISLKIMHQFPLVEFFRGQGSHILHLLLDMLPIRGQFGIFNDGLLTLVVEIGLVHNLVGLLLLLLVLDEVGRDGVEEREAAVQVLVLAPRFGHHRLNLVDCHFELYLGWFLAIALLSHDVLVG